MIFVRDCFERVYKLMKEKRHIHVIAIQDRVDSEPQVMRKQTAMGVYQERQQSAPAEESIWALLKQHVFIMQTMLN